ncbi:T9SS type A sorting domain-containing protein [Flammeovirga sp. SJP92]|uniref:T9SS type A sorting domain-containing protein n=1 Tax=Flammeovirga sp. SJP92 TaxID=1775430 RepID=UPI0007895601|nr:T9SS type A sorting domain-containing protein [Flammeovirga sp. SJP92]KXX70938.1 hypothetical protein AVL50_11250 [Flammeovirga sp. SJP92]
MKLTLIISFFFISLNLFGQNNSLVIYSDDDINFSVENKLSTSTPKLQTCYPSEIGYYHNSDFANWLITITNSDYYFINRVKISAVCEQNKDLSYSYLDDFQTPHSLSISNPYNLLQDKNLLSIIYGNNNFYQYRTDVNIEITLENGSGSTVLKRISFVIAPHYNLHSVAFSHNVGKETSVKDFNSMIYTDVYQYSYLSDPGGFINREDPDCLDIPSGSDWNNYIQIISIEEIKHTYYSGRNPYYNGGYDNLSYHTNENFSPMFATYPYNHSLELINKPIKYYEYLGKAKDKPELSYHVRVHFKVTYKIIETGRVTHSNYYLRVEFPSPPSVLGIETLTEKQTTYYIDDLEGYELSSWEVSSGIEVISKDSKSITVKGINYSNKGFIKANFKTGQSTVKEIKVWPALDELKLSDLIYSRNMLFCNQTFDVKVINHTGQRAEWIVIQGSLPPNGQSTHSNLTDGKHTNYIKSNVTRENDYVQVMVRIVRKNGTKTPYVSFSVSASCPGGGGDGDGYIPLFSSLRTKEIDGITDFGYKIYPNPVKGNLNIEANSTFMGNIDKITIYDINGNIIDNYEFIQYESNSYRINTDKYKPGLYILNINKSDGSVDIEKIIVE